MVLCSRQKKAKQKPLLSKPAKSGDEFGLTFEFTFAVADYCRAGMYRLEVDVDDTNATAVSEFQVSFGDLVSEI